MEIIMLSWQLMSYHGNQRMLPRQKKTSNFIVFLTNSRYCDSVTTPLTTAPREEQGPSTTILLQKGVLVTLRDLREGYDAHYIWKPMLSPQIWPRAAQYSHQDQLSKLIYSSPNLLLHSVAP